MARTRVLLIEDNRLLREGIAAMLEIEGDLEVIALAEDGDALPQMKESGKSPDVVLLDLGLERANSGQSMVLLRSKLPEARIIAMDILPEQADIVRFRGNGRLRLYPEERLSAGVCGYDPSGREGREGTARGVDGLALHPDRRVRARERKGHSR